jgi:hypothetical protein
MDRRDRHGRGMRGPLAPPSVPLAATRREEFDELVLVAAAKVSAHLEATSDQHLEEIAFAVEDVPAVEPDPPPPRIPLGHVVPATASTPPVVVLHRRTIEERTDRGAERRDLVEAAVVELVADLLGIDPEDVDPG